MRISIDDAKFGGFSDPRNITIFKVFNMINIGERAGTGISNIYSIWEKEGFPDPVIEEQFDPDRTTLTLVLSKKKKEKPIKADKSR
jgi:predicted HTH transcriptional regulator